MSKYSYQNPVLKTVDASIRNRLDARYTEIPVKVFPFSFTINETLKKNSTIELVRLPNYASLLQIVLENNFTDVDYELSNSLGKVLLTSNAGKVTDVFCNINCADESIILKVLSGSIKKGECVEGYVMFSAR